MGEKELLLKLGEETIYSAKGHFKACDIRRVLVTFTIWSCAILNIISLIGIDSTFDRILTMFTLIGLAALLIWNQGEDKNYRLRHKQIAEKYLALHKEIRTHYFLDKYDQIEVETLSKRVVELDQSEKPELPGIALKLARKAILKGETDNWFLEDK